MFCPKCGYQLNNDAKFCPSCGFPTTQTAQTGAGNNQLQQTPVVQNNAVPIYQQTHFNNAGQVTGKKKSRLWIIPVIAGALALLIVVLAVSIGLFGKSSSKGILGGLGASSSSSSDLDNDGKDGYEIGDIIEFGRYEQDGNYSNESEPIEWIILDKDGDKLLLISRYVLDAEQYTYSQNGAAWEDSAVYDWLVDGFFNSAFSYEEYKRVTTGTVRSGEESYLTSEYCFALSSDEIRYYAENVPELYICEPTKYAANMGVVISSDDNFTNKAYWYVRDKFLYGSIMAPNGVAWIGQIYKEDKYGLRPALWVTEKINEAENPVTNNRDYSNSKISGAESIYELIEILNNNEYISEETIYAMPPMIAALLAYGEDDYSVNAVSEVSKKTCAQIKNLMDANKVSEEFSGNRVQISDYKKLNKSQIDYTKQILHSDSFGWFDDVEEMWQTTGYVTEKNGRNQLEYLADDENDGDFDFTLAIIKKGGRYYWYYTGNW